jgi:hypothetical protein
MKRVITSDKPVTVLLLLWSHKCDIGAEPRSRVSATSAVQGLIIFKCMNADVQVAHVKILNGNNPIAYRGKDFSYYNYDIVVVLKMYECYFVHLS